MNKLLTHKGGQPVYLEDLDFIQESFAESFKNFVRAITDQEDIDEPIVLAGIKRFGSNGITGGIVAFGGRIFVVDQHDDIDDGCNYLNFIKTTGEPRRLKNGSTVDVYEYEDAEWDYTGWGYEDLYLINDELTKRLWQPIRRAIEQAADIQVPPVNDSSDYQSVGGKLTRTAGGYYVFQGELFTGDQFAGEQPYWASAQVTVYADLPSVTVYVPMCFNKSIIPGKVSTNHNTITVSFWTENAATTEIYNFTVMI